MSTYKQALQDIADGNYTPQRIEAYYQQLETVYNRTLSSGNYYLGKELGAYSHVHGSNATQERTHIGQVEHFFPQPSVAQIIIENGMLQLGDKLLIT
ncbi:MAG: hypothetical protein H6765_09230 [Candidatus Peribacteria bacterium]|nr:MAG: hypothetical protein H6765_09230 [Candidatus Peribacteria bacterium]